MNEVEKAIVLATSLGTKFLPLSKALAKEFWPLVDKPIIQYILEEIKSSEIYQIIFISSPEKKQFFSYLKKDLKLETILKKRKQTHSLIEIRNLQEFQKNLSINFVFQKKLLGNGHAILQAQDKIGKNPFAILLCNEIVESKIPCLAQLLKLFKTCQRPVVGLYRVQKEKVSSYDIAEVEKIANRFFKIKKIFKNPLPEKAPSDLAIIGRYILTPEIFDYLKKQKQNEKGEITLIDALENALKNGKIVYGYEIEGKLLECRDKINWLKSHLYLSLKHPQFGEELKKFFKEKLI